MRHGAGRRQHPPGQDPFLATCRACQQGRADHDRARRDAGRHARRDRAGDTPPAPDRHGSRQGRDPRRLRRSAAGARGLVGRPHRARSRSNGRRSCWIPTRSSGGDRTATCSLIWREISLAIAANELCLSAASAFEIAVKATKGHLLLPEDPDSYIRTRVATMGLRPLPVTIEPRGGSRDAASDHADPWDRLLVAQARLEACRS